METRLKTNEKSVSNIEAKLDRRTKDANDRASRLETRIDKLKAEFDKKLNDLTSKLKNAPSNLT